MASKKAEVGPAAEASLKAAAKHVSHDIRRLAESYEHHRSDPFAWTSWYVFCRSVMAFFDPPNRHDVRHDDILAEHFFDDPDEWRNVLKGAEPPGDYDCFRKATNKLAAHLTYSRIQYEGDDRWSPSAALTDYLIGLAGVFYSKLPEKRQLWFGRLVTGFLIGTGFDPRRKTQCDADELCSGDSHDKGT